MTSASATTAGGGVTVAGPRTIVKKPSIISNTTAAKKTTATSSGTTSVASSVKSLSPGSTPRPKPTPTVEDELAAKMQRITLTYKNRDKDAAIQRLEEARREAERRLETERKRVGGGAVLKETKMVGKGGDQTFGGGEIRFGDPWVG
jgi:hypothetical protein